ncbi:hypothetical protein ACHAWF_012028 [Thalassiosira exigua]
MGSSSAGSSGSSGAGTGLPMPTLPRSRSKKGSSGRKSLWKRLLKKGSSNSSAAEGDGRGDGSRDGLPPLQHQPQQQQRQLPPPAASSSSSADFSPLFEAAFETADLAAITSVSEAPPSPRGPQDDDPAASPRPSPRDSFRDSSRGRGGSARRSGGRPPAVVSPSSPSSSPGGGGSEARTTSATPKLGPPPSSSNPCTPSSSAGRSATPTGAGRSRTVNPAHPSTHPSAVTSGPGHSSWGGGTIVSECHTKETKNTKANTYAGTATTASMTTFAKSASRDGEPPSTGGASGTGASGDRGGGGSGNRMWGGDWKWAGGFVESHAVTETTASTTPSTGASGELGIPAGGGGRWAPWIDADDPPAGAGPAGPAAVGPAVADSDAKATALRPKPGPAPVASPEARVGSGGDRVPSPMISVEEGDDADADDENGPSMAVVVEEVTRVVDADGGSGRSSGAPKPQGLPPPRPSPSMFSGSKDSAEGRPKPVAGRGRFVGRGSVPSLKKRPKGGTSPPVSMGSGGGSSTGGMPRGLNAVAKTAAKGYAKGGALKASREGSPGSGTGMGRPGQGPGTNNKDGIDREDQPASSDPNAIAQEGGTKGCEDLKDQTFFDSLRHDQGGDGAAAAAPSPAPKSGPKDGPWESDARNLNTTDDAIAAPNAKITVDAPRGGTPHKAAAAGGGREADLSSEEPHLYAEINIPTSKVPYRRQGSGSRRHPKADKTSPYKFASAAEAPLSKRQSSARSQGTSDVSLAMTSVSDLTGRSSMFGSPRARGGPYGPDGGLDLVAAVARCGVAGAGAALVGPPALEAGAGGGDDPYARHEEENYFEYGGDEKLYMKPENRGGLGVVRESGEGSSPTDSAGEGGGGEDDGIFSRLLGVWNEAFGSTCRCFDGPGSPGAGPGEGGGEQPPWGASTVAGTAGGGAKSLGWSAGAGTVMETVNDTAATIAGLSKALSSSKRAASSKADAGEERGPMFSDPMD